MKPEERTGVEERAKKKRPFRLSRKIPVGRRDSLGEANFLYRKKRGGKKSKGTWRTALVAAIVIVEARLNRFLHCARARAHIRLNRP